MKNIKTKKFYQNLLGKKVRACITGASAGIGKEFSEQLAKAGFNLLLIARRKERLQSLKKGFEQKYTIHCDVLAADLASDRDISNAAEYIKQHPDICILVNNAGFGFYSNFNDAPLSKHLEMINVHNKSTVELSYAAIKNMKTMAAGLLLNVSSMAAFTRAPGSAMYNATKSFLNSFSHTLWAELKNKNIHVQALCPGFTHTEFHKEGKLKTFKDTIAPRWIWMSAKKVACLSLFSAAGNKKPIYIPGAKNRFFKSFIYANPLILKLVDNIASKRTSL